MTKPKNIFIRILGVIALIGPFVGLIFREFALNAIDNGDPGSAVILMIITQILWAASFVAVFVWLLAKALTLTMHQLFAHQVPHPPAVVEELPADDSDLPAVRLEFADQLPRPVGNSRKFLVNGKTLTVRAIAPHAWKVQWDDRPDLTVAIVESSLDEYSYSSTVDGTKTERLLISWTETLELLSSYIGVSI